MALPQFQVYDLLGLPLILSKQFYFVLPLLKNLLQLLLENTNHSRFSKESILFDIVTKPTTVLMLGDLINTALSLLMK